jgi:hypothetical protein
MTTFVIKRSLVLQCGSNCAAAQDTARFDQEYVLKQRPDALRFMRRSMEVTAWEHYGKGKPDVLHYSFQAHTV